MDRTTVRSITADVLEALVEVGRKHNVQFTSNGARFGDTSAVFKIEAAEINASGEVQSAEAEAFKRNAGRFGFEVSDLGRDFTIGRSTYTLTGLKPRRSKYPVSATRQDGKQFKFPARSVLDALGKGTRIEGLTPEIKSGFVDLACQLSPENLTCDGELGASAVSARRAQIKREWAALEARVGRKVSERETWAW